MPAEKEYELRDSIVPGFLLKVTPGGRKNLHGSVPDLRRGTANAVGSRGGLDRRRRRPGLDIPQ
jgi:hypothetical protein